MLLKPQPDCPFASEMVLNPAVIRDPKTGRLHMLIRVSGPWLLNFHGKKDDTVGYTQSFMILKERDGDFPEITHLYPKRWIVNEAYFEEPRKFGIPCVFFTGAVPMGDKLFISYGAADEFAAVMELDMSKIISVLHNYPYNK